MLTYNDGINLNLTKYEGRFKMISLELMSKENSIDIYFFEKENKKYFEQNLLPRPINYFHLESFKEITNELLVEQDNHEVYMYLIRNFQGVIVGRINLIIFGNDKKTAELGYRIGENYTNLGYASEAVKIVLDKAFNIYALNKIIAGTATDNFASKKVLKKNGFTFSRIIENDLQINNKWIHTEVYEITNL